MVLLSVLVSALAFSPGPASFRTERCSAPVMSMDRRSALLGAAAAAAAAVPLAANAEVFQGGTSLGFDDGKDYNKGTEEAMAAIAAKNRAKEEAKKAAFLASRREKTGDEILEEQEAKKQLIINGRRPQLLRIVTLLSLRDLFVPSYVAVAAGGSLLSVPFFLPNLFRCVTYSYRRTWQLRPVAPCSRSLSSCPTSSDSSSRSRAQALTMATPRSDRYVERHARATRTCMMFRGTLSCDVCSHPKS